jgi:hypothetical protein
MRFNTNKHIKLNKLHSVIRENECLCLKIFKIQKTKTDFCFGSKSATIFYFL